mmetsp:Transcript_14229/g.43051  ORF Transcript_14229/g.43051 Transcript_14229/m.43051 type:complete len:422 (-) Transcript_14229:2204-3469(-)
MPAAKLRPVSPRTTRRPPVMYSAPWSPRPSTTARAPLLRTQNRSPALPRKNASPRVAPYRPQFPTITLSEAVKVGCASWSSSGLTTTRPPDRPLAQPSFASPRTLMVTPGAKVKPRHWPEEPFSETVMESSGRPATPHFLEMTDDNIVPKVWSTFVRWKSRAIGSKDSPLACASIRGIAASINALSAFFSSSWSCTVAWNQPASGFSSRAGCRRGAKSRPRVLSGRPFLRSTFGSTSNTSPAAPTNSSILVMPRDARILRTSSANSQKKLTTCSGMPSNFARSSGSCVAIPTGHVFWWHLRIMMQPSAISGPVEKAYSSAPRAQAMATSRADLSWPSVWRRMRSRRPFNTRVCCVSATPSSHGRPAHLMPVQAAAPVPPSPPDTVMWSAFAFATPAATTPTPTSETNFTETWPSGLAHFKS